MYAQRAQRLKEEGRENFMTDAQIAEGMRYGSENPEFGQVFAEYKSFNETLMQFLKDTGSIDEETKQLIGTADYVPFYRLLTKNNTQKVCWSGTKGFSVCTKHNLCI